MRNKNVDSPDSFASPAEVMGARPPRKVWSRPTRSLAKGTPAKVTEEPLLPRTPKDLFNKPAKLPRVDKKVETQYGFKQKLDVSMGCSVGSQEVSSHPIVGDPYPYDNYRTREREYTVTWARLGTFYSGEIDVVQPSRRSGEQWDLDSMAVNKGKIYWTWTRIKPTPIDFGKALKTYDCE